MTVIKEEIKFSEMLYMIDNIVNCVLVEDENGNIEYHPESLDLYFRFWLIKMYTDYPIVDECSTDVAIGEGEEATTGSYVDVDKAYELVNSDKFNMDVFCFSQLNKQQEYIYNIIKETIDKKLQIMCSQRHSMTDKALAELLMKVPTLLEKLTQSTDGISPEELKKFIPVVNKLGNKVNSKNFVKAMIDSGLVERPAEKENIKKE